MQTSRYSPFVSRAVQSWPSGQLICCLQTKWCKVNGWAGCSLFAHSKSCKEWESNSPSIKSKRSGAFLLAQNYRNTGLSWSSCATVQQSGRLSFACDVRSHRSGTVYVTLSVSCLLFCIYVCVWDVERIEGGWVDALIQNLHDGPQCSKRSTGRHDHLFLKFYGYEDTHCHERSYTTVESLKLEHRWLVHHG